MDKISLLILFYMKYMSLDNYLQYFDISLFMKLILVNFRQLMLDQSHLRELVACILFPFFI